MGNWKTKLKQIAPVRAAAEAVRGRLQERYSFGVQRRYEADAARHGVTVPEGDALRAAVMKRLESRGVRPAGKRMGEMHVFLAYVLHNWEAVLPRSLAPFGRVTEFQWKWPGPGTDVAAWRAEMNGRMLAAFAEARERYGPVDAVVGYVSGYSVNRETLAEMGRAGAVLFNFCYDDKLCFPGENVDGHWMSPAELASVVDLNLTSVPSALVKYAVHGGLAMFWPEAAHPEVHRPYDVPFEYDVSFVGAAYGWRPKFIRRLKEMGVHVECFGRGWPNGPLSDEEMVRLYSRSRITLGFGGIGHSRRLMCLKGRDFEVPMSGGLYLTQDNPELRLVFDVGKEIVTYRDEADCAATIRHLLAHPDEAAEIRQAGRRRALAEHTYEHRWSDAFRMAGLLA
jgi:spore maturation protein CgeB